MLRNFLISFSVLLVAMPSQSQSQSSASPLLTNGSVPEVCASGAFSGAVSLVEAVDRALCANAKARGAWARIKVYAAAVKTSREAYLPNADIKAAETESRTLTLIRDDRALDTAANDLYPAASLSLSWVLYDFGQRRHQLDSARELLAAARANLDLTLQQVFLHAAADYYDVQAAQANQDSSLEIEGLTQRSVAAAHLRVEKGVAPISDELQTQTAYALAVVNRVKSAAEFKVKRGTLAGDMGIEPDQIFTLPPADLSQITQTNFTESVHDLIEEAKRDHPSVAMAERTLAAAMADEKASRSHGLPRIALVGGISRSNESLTPSLGSPSVPGSVSNKSVGIQIDVPISDALWKRGQIKQAHAQVDAQQEELRAVEQQVAQDVWRAYAELQADTDNLENLEMLMDSARRSLDSTQHRYERGVGNISELLSSQGAYATARTQRIQALADWRYARLALGASLGKLGLSAID